MIRRRRFLVLLLLVFTANRAPARADGPIGRDDSKAAAEGGVQAREEEAPEVQIPERNIQFVESSEAYSMKLFRADPKLLEQKYAVILQLRFPSSLQREFAARLSGVGLPGLEYVPAELRKVAVCWTPDSPYAFSLISPTRVPVPAGAYFPQLLEHVPKESLPPEDVVAFFTHEAQLGYLQAEMTRSKGGSESSAFRSESVIQFVILAPSVERGEQLAKGLLTLLDQGFTRGVQEYILSLRRTAEAELKKQTEALEAAQAKLDDLKRRLDSPATVDPKLLGDLNTQRLLVEVDLAGVRARIDAAERMLRQQEELPPERIEPIQTIKITAEIELAGLTARREALASLIQQANDRGKLIGDAAKAESSTNSLKRAVAGLKRRIEEINQALDALGPFRLYGSHVVLQPLKWRQ